MKNKKTKLGIVGLIFLAGCSMFKSRGSIDISYVPNRCDDYPKKNE